jgi:Pregnancy-associated plasma protein-A/Secretion system C-terminal sorting domain
MIKSFLLFLALLFLFSANLNAQPPCGFDKLHTRLLLTDPVYARQIEANKIAIQKFIEAHPQRKGQAARPQAAYTIPVVVHVMHTGGAVGTIYNPTDAQIMGAINYLNQVYAGTFPGMTAPVEGGGVVDLEIQFALAQRTPACGATNGINRVDASSLPNYTANGVNASNATGCPDLTMKNFSRWNPSDYYNIWIVNKIDGADGTSGQFIAGYAYFAGAPSTLDGTVMLATQMISGQKTLPHEIGHALNLYHPFEDSNDDTDCPVNTNCTTTGDLVCDTDPITLNYNVGSGLYNFACRTGANGCAAPNNYTINTESNFMSYTNCYTLFTNGQKARVQAAMTLPSRASLVSGTNLALTPCGTTINFSQANASRTEDITGTLNGCRRYREYTYQMAIGAAPTATATATLTYSGTAVKGIDYDVTTNGSFATPSDVLTFTAGSTTSQSFNVRIYDDADVEAGETAVIDFTVNNGGGDASEGTTTPTFTITIPDNDLAPTGSSSGTYAVGVASGAINQTPFDARLLSQRAQFIYRANELTAAGVNPGTITSLQLFLQLKVSTRPFTNFSIKMAHTNLNYLVDGSASVVGGMTTVYSSASYPTIAGWNNFTLSAPFAWDGVNNLAIEFCFNNVTADAGNGADQVRTFLDGGTAGQGSTVFENGINCAQAFSSISFFGSGRKPIIQIGNVVIGTSIETVAGSNTSVHIESGSSDYFYSNNNRLLMRLTGISAPLGCVASSLDEAGTTWLNYQGGQRSAKVFAVTPTTNGGSANYSISLYFDNAELGGKTPATLRIAKTTAASVAASNVSNTVLLTPTVTTLGAGTTIFTANFTGFSHFFLVDAGVALAIELTDFSGVVTSEQNSLLSWTTASEKDNRQFEIEVSRDGVNFDLLASIPSKGNANHDQRYEYLHVKPQRGISFYRLKQTDLDGKYTYSKIIALSIVNNLTKASVYPVPAKNTITINFGEIITNGVIRILSADLRTVKQETVNGPSVKKDINVSQLSTGVYFIRYTSGTTNEIMRFVKE